MRWPTMTSGKVGRKGHDSDGAHAHRNGDRHAQREQAEETRRAEEAEGGHDMSVRRLEERLLSAGRRAWTSPLTRCSMVSAAPIGAET